MGFFENIGAAISTVGGAIGSALTTAGRWISDTVEKISPVVTEFADRFLSVVAQIPRINLDTVKVIVETAGKVVHSICELLDIQSEENVEVLGAKAGQAEKTMADFGNDTEAYIRYLKEGIEVDKEKLNNMTEEQKLGCRTVGIALEAKAIEERIGGIKISPEYLVALTKICMESKLFLGAKEIVDMIVGLKEAGVTDLNDLVDYWEGRGNSDRVKTGQILKSVLEGSNLKEDVDGTIEEMKQSIRRFEEE